MTHVKTTKAKANMTALRMLRQAKGLTLAQLAGRIGSSVACVSAWETGRNSPSSRMVPKLARALGLEPMSLLQLMNPDNKAAPSHASVH